MYLCVYVILSPSLRVDVCVFLYHGRHPFCLRLSHCAVDHTHQPRGFPYDHSCEFVVAAAAAADIMQCCGNGKPPLADLLLLKGVWIDFLFECRKD